MNKLSKISALMLSATLLMSGCKSTGESDALSAAQINSGFLSNYTVLEAEKSAEESFVRSYSNKKVDLAAYKNIIIEPLTYYPQLPELMQANAEVLNEIKDYAQQELTKDLQSKFTITNEAGEDTLRLKVAISAIAIDDKKLSAYQYLPIVFIGKLVSGGMNDMSVKMQTEMELTDSVSGEVIASAVKRGEGEKLSSEASKLTKEHLTPLINQWVKAFSDKFSS